MCVEYQTTTIFNSGCQNPQCNLVQHSPGMECDQKPLNENIRQCPNYELRVGAPNRVRGKCPAHRT